ncbi:MAG: Flp pilus assembly protein CpaB [Selenomonas sp.]|nr:Flp pilus assembly protein CpaB [Selenomonas sp.]
MFNKLLNALNDMQPRQLLLLAGGAAVAVFLLVYVALTSFVKEAPQKQETAQRTPVMHYVVMAKEDIPPRTIIREDMLEVRDMPVEAVPEGAIMSLQDVVGTMSMSKIYSGDVVTVQKVYSDKSQAGFTGAIPEDCRAVSVSVSAVTGVGGFARPGDYVDVIMVEKDKQGATSHLLLQNILLLGVNQEAEARNGGAEGKEGKETKEKVSKPAIATLALRPEDTLELVSAASVGEIYLVLRPFRPKAPYVLQNDFTLRASYAPVKETPTVVAAPAPAPAPAAAPAPAREESSSGIMIIEGDKVK